MRLTSMQTQTRNGLLELIIELDGAHYEAEVFAPNTNAADLADRLRRLAFRIERRVLQSREALEE
jgi:hypothetical protein